MPKVDRSFFASNELVTLNCVKGELEALSRKKRTKDAIAARTALRVVEKEDLIKTVKFAYEEPAEVDNLLIEYVALEPHGRILATLDGSLIKRLQKNNLDYVTLRNEMLFISRPNKGRYLSLKSPIS